MARTVSQYNGTGRRKAATARVYLRPGNGRIFVNKRPVEQYFVRETLRMDLTQPLNLTETSGSYDTCLLYTSPSPRDQRGSRMPSSA